MTVSAVQYQAAVDELTGGLRDLRLHLGRVGPATTAAANNPILPPKVGQLVLSVGEKLVELGSWLLEKITELLKGAAAPGYFIAMGLDWQDVRGLASGVAGDLKPETLEVGRLWQGPAAAAYSRQIPPQVAAASRIAAVADKTATGLLVCAGAGLAFYLALAVIVTKFIVALVAAIAALGSVVFSWAGLLLVVEEAGVNTGMVIAAVSALVALLGIQAQQMVALHGEAVDAAAFPSGQWPNARADQFSDATVTDGDADWSVKG
jgi:hypothetical protein